MTARPNGAAGYWYGDTSAVVDDPRSVLEALRRYRAAEMAMRRRTRDEMDMNETDLAALRYVMRAERDDRVVTPTDLMAHLGVTMASITVMIDRLERSGHLRREANPKDRRSRVIVSTELCHSEVRATLDTMHRRMYEAVSDMTPADIGVVVGFLDRMEHAVDGIAPAAH